MVYRSPLRRSGLVRRLGVYGSFNRNVYILLLFTLGKGFQLSIGALTLNLYVYSLGYDIQFVGVFAATSALGSLLAAVPIGMLADRIGRKPLLLFSGYVTPLTLVLIAFSTSPVALILTGLLNGLIASAYWVTNLPILTESTTAEQRVGAMALNNFLLLGVGALGALIGGGVPEIAGLLLHQSAQDTVPLRFGILASAVIVLLPALPLFLIQVPRPSRRTIPPARPDMAGPAGVAPEVNIGVNTGVAPVEPALGVIELKMPESRLGVAALFAKLLVPDILFTIGEGAVVGLLSVFFFLRFTLQPGPLGILFTLAGLVGGGASLAAPRIVRNWSKLPMATTMQFFTVPALLLTGFSPFLLLSVAGELMRQILRGLFEPVYAAFAMERVSSRYRGTLSGFYSVTWGVGYSIGPITGGLLIKHAGLYGPFVIAAGCIGLSGIMLRLFFGKEEREERFESQHKPAEESH